MSSKTSDLRGGGALAGLVARRRWDIPLEVAKAMLAVVELVPARDEPASLAHLVDDAPLARLGRPAVRASSYAR
ncbi:hypothetical protein [Nannocystis pusilla]|uniref:hypothetical protein n=1 Tax=Nannocystis pusilla TaxID=889268 RepID=UPI003DA251AB